MLKDTQADVDLPVKRWPSLTPGLTVVSYAMLDDQNPKNRCEKVHK